MKTRIVLFASLFALMGCQNYPDQTLHDIDGGAHSDNACPMYKYISNISVEVSTNSNLPEKLSGSVNDKLVLDECALGQNTHAYSIVKKDSRTVVIGIWVDNNRQLIKEFFDASGKPRENATIHLKLKGRSNCDDRETTVAEVHKVLSWEPVYTNSKDCGASGYTAIVD